MLNMSSPIKCLKRSNHLLVQKITDKLLKSFTLYLKQNQSSSNNISLKNFIKDRNKENMRRKRRIISKIQEKFVNRQELEKIKLIKEICLTNQPVVKIRNILLDISEDPVDINAFAKKLNLMPVENKIEGERNVKLKCLKYNGNIPFSSNLGKLLVERDIYKVTQPLIFRKQDKIEYYLKPQEIIPENKDYPITYKDKEICARRYNYPGRLRLKSENCISYVPRVKIRPVSVRLIRMDLSGFAKHINVVINKNEVDEFIRIKKDQKRKLCSNVN